MLTESLESSGDIDGAAAQFERVLNLKLRTVGMNMDTVAEAQYQLACVSRLARYSRARELQMEAVGTFRRSGGERLARGYEALAQLEEDMGTITKRCANWHAPGKCGNRSKPNTSRS